MKFFEVGDIPIILGFRGNKIIIKKINWEVSFYVFYTIFCIINNFNSHSYVKSC